MKKKQKTTDGKMSYVRPQFEIIEVKAAEVICSSNPSAASDRFGGSFGEPFGSEEWTNDGNKTDGKFRW